MTRDPTDSRPRLLAMHIDADPALVGAVRTTVRRTLGVWGLAEQADDMVLVASELVSNAVSHGQPARGISVRLRATDDDLLLEITDDADRLPSLCDATTDDEQGRGVFLVGALTDAWGCRPNQSGGKIVWARMTLREPIGLTFDEEPVGTEKVIRAG